MSEEKEAEKKEEAGLPVEGEQQLYLCYDCKKMKAKGTHFDNNTRFECDDCRWWRIVVIED